MRSINNSFDSSHDTMVVDGSDFSFTGEYESNLDKRYILINGYTEATDTIYIYNALFPTEGTLKTDVYTITPSQDIRIVSAIKFRFFKIKIMSSTQSARRAYDVYMLDNISDYQNTDTSGNVIVRNYTSDTSGNGIHSTNNKLNVYDQSGNSKLNDIYVALSSSSGSTSSVTLWLNESITSEETSAVADLSTKRVANLTFFGTSGDGVGNITVQFSNDGTTFYDSQYVYGVVIAGHFGFNIQCSPKYIRLKSDATTTSSNCSAYLNYS
jgi:hypothetical protein